MVEMNYEATNAANDTGSNVCALENPFGPEFVDIELNLLQTRSWIDKGYGPLLIPLRFGDKVPSDSGWTTKDFVNEIEARVARSSNVGLRLNDLIAIDVEGSALGERLAGEVAARYPDAPRRSRDGSQSNLFLFRRGEGACQRWEIMRPREIAHESANGTKLVEVLAGAGRQAHIIGPRSDKHGARLVWTGLRHIDALPELDADALEALGEALLAVVNAHVTTPIRLSRGGAVEASSRAVGDVSSHAPDHIDERDAPLLAECLDAIPRDARFEDRDARVKLQHAVWGATQGAAWGLDLFLEWDAKEHPDNLHAGDPERAAGNWSRMGNSPIRSGAGHIRQLLEERGRHDLRDRLNQACASKKFEEKTAAAYSTHDGLPAAEAAMPDIPGGVYEPDQAMALISARFTMVDFGGEVCVVHRDRDGVDHILGREGLADKLANVWVSVGDIDKPKTVLAATWWRRNPERPPVRKAVFRTDGSPIANNEYNFWRGYGVPVGSGFDKIRPFMRHLREVICRHDRRNFRYLLKWMAWVVQNPEKQAGVVVVLKSDAEGTGKTTVSEAMRKLFGGHATSISDPTHLLGTHAGEGLENVVFVSLEEALFAGNRAQSDRCKDVITGASIFVNPKGRKTYTAVNRMSAMLTTNHDHAIDAANGGRRWFVLEVDESKACDKSWFDPIYAGLESGGYGQLLGFLLRIDLGDWNPRAVRKTAALAHQQILSATGVEAWLLECAGEGGVTRYDANGKLNPFAGQLDLDNVYTNDVLYASLLGYRQERAARWDVPSRRSFGRAISKILGPTARREGVTLPDGGQGRGYRLPPQDELRAALERHLRMDAGTLAVRDD